MSDVHKITTIGEHSICMDLLPEKATIMDGGCRGFDISIFFRKNPSIRIINIDIDELPDAKEKTILWPDGNVTVHHQTDTSIDKIKNYYNLGISDRNGNGRVLKNPVDPQSTQLLPDYNFPYSVSVYTIKELKKLLRIEWFDYIKLDIEGSEYKILETENHPMATQVSVEFHEHTDRKIGKEKLDQLLDKLSEKYHIYNRNWESRHGAGFNYWDVLMIAKY